MTGRVVHKRNVSRKLMFVDILAPTGRRSVVLKANVCGEETLARAQKTSAKIHVGDVVAFEFDGDEDDEEAAKDFTVLERWSESNPDRTFQPRPPTACNNGVHSRGLCKFWANTGRCPKGDGCRFLHEAVPEEIVRNARLSSLAFEGDGDEESLLLSRHRRAEVFADWIWDKFRDCITGKLVLDVAGGKGDLAFELSYGKGVDCSVVDPRNPGKMEAMALPRWKRKLVKKQPNKKPPVHYETQFDAEFCRRHVFGAEDVGLIVGMHPDRATVAIVDLSLRFGKPFAVVPCCVFAHENPLRKLTSDPSTSPRTYEQFCQYLMEKDDRIQSDVLNFQGRNLVLYWRPPPND